MTILNKGQHCVSHYVSSNSCLLYYLWTSTKYLLLAYSNRKFRHFLLADQRNFSCWPLYHNLLTLSWRRLLSYRNQSIDLQSKSTFSFYMIKSSVIKELSYLECITSFLQNLTGTSICSSSTTLLSDLSNMTLKNDGF